ncbi:exodeoxyribonuclease-3 [Pigmentiphaga litoralis]|uniref:Exodeoxyribonuclease-3 n=1 Tax=Pigmentiphaga litoralis TaxID=516702 RepID=A0A7Y9IW30_9BURK|nr:exodeoxyribonuclease-3 [Pigmentiphaga litoralis]NYE84147.1 exodeoxyribonuclease-3 [Pigmentiphaga litoralis]
MKIATFNINGIRARLPALLEWLGREAPDVACLQELKTTDATFPADEIRAAGYGVISHGQKSWNGVAILARDTDPVETRRGLPGFEKDEHSRYLEAAVNGVLIGCLYLPNGNPQPGPKFDYKLAWFEHFLKHAQTLFDSGHPVVLAGDYNVVPTDDDIYNPKSWLKDALLQPESRECFARLVDQGWTDALRAQYPDERIYTFWDYFRQHWQKNSGLRIDHLLLSKDLAPRLESAGVDRWVRDLPHASDHAPTWIVLGEAKTAVKKTAAKKTAAKKAEPKKAAVKKAAPKKSASKTAAAEQVPATPPPAKKASATQPAQTQPAQTKRPAAPPATPTSPATRATAPKPSAHKAPSRRTAARKISG